jgi:hypothetical protein
VHRLTPLSWNRSLVAHLRTSPYSCPNYVLPGIALLEPLTTTRYISLFWKEFAANKRKNVAGERIADVVRREQALEDLTAQYIKDAEALSGWTKGKRTLTLSPTRILTLTPIL